MSSRLWFFASGGQQQGPYPEDQFRDLIAKGVVRAETLVWTDGMASWQKAGEIPGLLSGATAPPAMPQGAVVNSGGYRGGALSIDLAIWEFTWRSLLLLVGLILIVPTPWVLVWYLRWIVSRVHVPGRPNLSFIGQPMTIVAWYFGTIVVVICVELIGIRLLSNLMFLVQFALYWLFIKWFVANLASDGQPLGITFSGTFWAYLGWNILTALSIVTIIGWAWVYAAQMRWLCRNIQGTRRQVTFKGTGLEYLWRIIVAAIASSFIIPIPWVARWLIQWQLSQTELLERGAPGAV